MTATVPPPPRTGSGARPRPDLSRAAFEQRLGRARETLRASGEVMEPGRRVLVWTLAVFAATALWLVLFGLVLSGLVESHDQNDLYDRFRGELAASTAPVSAPIADGAPVTLLDSPAADLHRVVAVQGSGSSELRSGPGHFPGTPLPGQAGVSLILGRSTSFGAPFGGITDLHRGDTITATTGQGRFVYVVRDVRRPGDPLPPALSAGGSRLTLVTAAGDGWRSGWAPSYAVYVDADLKGRAAGGSATGFAAAHDSVLAHDTRGLYPLVLWLQLLLVAGVGAVWLRARWGASRSWLLAVPVGLAGLWGASTAMWLLLPNLV